jgi:predicted transcriptional regulator
MRVLLSIKPEYTTKILSGEKTYEFRKQIPKRKIKKVFIYESYPTKNIVGWFSIKGILSGSPEEIWEKCKTKGGINKDKYFTYCNGNKIVHAFEIDEIVRFNSPINPVEIDPKFKAPQNFSYLDDSIIFNEIEYQEDFYLCQDTG